MKHLRRVVGVVCGLGVLASILACGAASDAFNAGFDLGLIAGAYEAFEKDKGKPPANADELEKFASEKEPAATNAVKETKAGGKYVVNWGTKMGDGNKILAYQSKAPNSGGVVIMANKEVKNVATGDEFNKLKK